MNRKLLCDFAEKAGFDLYSGAIKSAWKEEADITEYMEIFANLVLEEERKQSAALVAAKDQALSLALDALQTSRTKPAKFAQYSGGNYTRYAREVQGYDEQITEHKAAIAACEAALGIKVVQS